MPKFRVTINYSIQMTEIHEVEFGSEETEELAEFHDGCADDYCGEHTLLGKIEGDCVNGSWNTHIEEINPLDQIVAALEESDKVD